MAESKGWAPWQAIRRGYLRLITPVADWLVRRRVHPNTITIIGTACTVATGALFATGWIKVAGWFLGITALFDVLDGTVARRTGTSSVFGAFFDSTLDRVADGALMGGLVIFYAFDTRSAHPVMCVIALLGLIGTFLTSYTRARAEALGIDAHVGMLQRPERITLLAAPQAFFGVSFHGMVLATVVTILTITAWLTAWQRMEFVRHAAMQSTFEETT